MNGLVFYSNDAKIVFCLFVVVFFVHESMYSFHNVLQIPVTFVSTDKALVYILFVAV